MGLTWPVIDNILKPFSINDYEGWLDYLHELITSAVMQFNICWKTIIIVRNTNRNSFGLENQIKTIHFLIYI